MEFFHRRSLAIEEIVYSWYDPSKIDYNISKMGNCWAHKKLGSIKIDLNDCLRNGYQHIRPKQLFTQQLPMYMTKTKATWWLTMLTQWLQTCTTKTDIWTTVTDKHTSLMLKISNDHHLH